MHSELHRIFVSVRVLLENVDAAAKFFYFDATNDPRSDPLHKHIILVFSSKDLELLRKVFLGRKLLSKVPLLQRDQLEVLAKKGSQELTGTDCIVFKNAR